MRTYSTSEIAGIIGVHPNTIMLYEKWGYIVPVERKENGYRVYTETHLEQIPWSGEAFARAVSEDKPIFLSNGYSCCHWCHVY